MASNKPQRNLGSFRDPSGYIFTVNQEIIRTINPSAESNFHQVIDTGLVTDLIQSDQLIPSVVFKASKRNLLKYQGPRNEIPALLVKHPKINFISYPYEWTFAQLKDAALIHLEIQIKALQKKVILQDATAFNMQFYEKSCVHIDLLSFQPYQENEPWYAYNQFCRCFLLPLLIEAWAGIPFQPLLRGKIDGVSFDTALRILPKIKLLTSINGLIHVYAQAKLLSSTNANKKLKNHIQAQLPYQRYLALIRSLHHWISQLQSSRSKSYWSNYAVANSYSASMRQTKSKLVFDWVKGNLIGGDLWDIGGNSGDFSLVAIEAGAKSVVIMDSDLDALEVAYQKRKAGHNILPLCINLADPSPSLGWNLSERMGLHQRAQPDGIIALAFIHHIVIGQNIPLAELLEWMISQAPYGIVEFVPKTDPMVEELLMHRKDVFTDYDEQNFISILRSKVHIIDSYKFALNGRLIVSYKRK